MKLRRLGFDLDNVIADTSEALINYAKETHGVELTEEQKKIFGWENTPGIDQKIVEDILEKVYDEEFFMEVAPLGDAVEALRFLKRKGRSIHILTARPTDNFPMVSKWLKKNGLWYHSLACCPNIMKPRMAAELKLQTFVDDRYDVLLRFINFRQSGRWRKLAMMHQDWNANLRHDRLFRVRNWDEIIELFEVKGKK